MNKLYYPINWENYPSEATPINESNLNKIDSGLNNLDNRVIEQDALKLSKTDASNDIVNWTMDEETGVITITRRSGEQILFDLNIEKIPVSFSLSDDGILTMVTDDGTTFTANIGAMIPILTFSDSDEIAVTATGTGINKTYSFSIKDNSITENKLQPNFLADIKVQSANASASASSAASSANDSSTYATQSKSYAVGGTGTRTGEDTDNAKYYNEQAQQALSEMQKSQVTGVKGDNETEFRTGEVNLTSEDIGAVKIGGDVAENIVTYESNDCGPDGDPALWEIPKLTTGEKLSSIMQKVSRIANNFRYMIKLLGTTDISAIGDGTVTGAVNTLNDSLKWKLLTTFNGASSTYYEVDLTQYREILVTFKPIENKIYSVLIPTIELEDESNYYITGSYQNSSTNSAMVRINTKKSGILFAKYGAYFVGSDVSSSTIVKVYVR